MLQLDNKIMYSAFVYVYWQLV